MQFKQFFVFFTTLSLALANSYILVFEQGQLTPNKYVQSIKDNIVELGGTIGHEYSTVLTGFAFKLPEIVSLSSITQLSDPNYPFFIEKDSAVSINDNDN